MSCILYGLKLSEVVALFESGEAEMCRPQSFADAKNSFYPINDFSLCRHIDEKWDVVLKEQKREITLVELEKAWNDNVLNYPRATMSGAFCKFAKQLGFK